MTDAEWLVCDDPNRMLCFLRERASERKLRLFACACYHDYLVHAPDRRVHDVHRLGGVD